MDGTKQLASKYAVMDRIEALPEAKLSYGFGNNGTTKIDYLDQADQSIIGARL